MRSICPVIDMRKNSDVKAWTYIQRLVAAGMGVRIYITFWWPISCDIRVNTSTYSRTCKIPIIRLRLTSVVHVELFVCVYQ